MRYDGSHHCQQRQSKTRTQSSVGSITAASATTSGHAHSWPPLSSSPPVTESPGERYEHDDAERRQHSVLLHDVSPCSPDDKRGSLWSDDVRYAFTDEVAAVLEASHLPAMPRGVAGGGVGGIISGGGNRTTHDDYLVQSQRYMEHMSNIRMLTEGTKEARMAMMVIEQQMVSHVDIRGRALDDADVLRRLGDFLRTATNTQDGGSASRYRVASTLQHTSTTVTKTDKIRLILLYAITRRHRRFSRPSAISMSPVVCSALFDAAGFPSDDDLRGRLELAMNNLAFASGGDSGETVHGETKGVHGDVIYQSTVEQRFIQYARGRPSICRWIPRLASISADAATGALSEEAFPYIIPPPLPPPVDSDACCSGKLGSVVRGRVESSAKKAVTETKSSDGDGGGGDSDVSGKDDDNTDDGSGCGDEPRPRLIIFCCNGATYSELREVSLAATRTGVEIILVSPSSMLVSPGASCLEIVNGSVV